MRGIQIKISERIKRAQFPCTDTDKNNYIMPSADIDMEGIRIFMVTEAPPAAKADYFCAQGNPAYLQTILQVFKDAGHNFSSMEDILNLGVYITTAVKYGKTQYTVSPETMNNCATAGKGDCPVP